MKIYPNKKIIKLNDKVNMNTDIPLAYIKTENEFKYELKNNYNNESKKILMPYDTIDTLTCIFDENNNQIESSEYSTDFIYNHDINKYQYIPNKNSTKFKPIEFNYTISGKKKMEYSSSMFYNMSLSVAKNTVYANKLMQVFGDAYLRNLAPNNFSINNKSIDIESLLNSKSKDGIFYVLKNMTTLLTDNGLEEINIDYIKESNEQNVFFIIQNDIALNESDGVVIDNSRINLLQSTTRKRFVINKNNIYNTDLSTKYYFNIPKDTTDKHYFSIFTNKQYTPILIEEIVNDKFIIYVTADFIDNITDNYRCFYEMLSYVYFNSYIKSDKVTGWVSEIIPDYTLENNILINKNKFTSYTSIYNILKLLKNQVYNIAIKTDNPNVIFDKIENDYAIFTTKDIKDPYIKKDNEISVYANGNIYIYSDFLYLIVDELDINIEQTDKQLKIYINKFRNSYESIYIKKEQTLFINLYNVINNIEYAINDNTYYVVCERNDSVSIPKIVQEVNDNQLLLATIEVSKTKTKDSIYDMRQRGGGLPEELPDNYDCFDIGNYYGRPYRKGGSMIITLPKKLEEHREYITGIIKQYMQATDYPIIMFKENE